MLLAAWFAATAVVVTVTGGLESPALALLLAAPFAACASGRLFLALEALVLAGLLVLALIVFGPSATAAPEASYADKEAMAAGLLLITALAGLAGLTAPQPEARLAVPAAGVDQEARIRAAMAQVEEAERKREGANAYYAALGHDLKTPLNAILGFSDLMRSEMLGEMPAAYKDYAGLINDSGQDLLLLVEDILDLSKSEANRQRLDIEPIELTASGEAVVRQLEGVALRNGVEVRVAERGEVWASADARAVRQIWQNLLSNAIKYSETGDVVVLKTKSLGEETMLSVSDTGIGMSDEDLQAILQPFARGANVKGRAGTGLGLTVVHRFAELHGGRMRIDSQPGGGTRVTVILPAADPADLASFDEAAE